jgi:hypothetical protein
MNVGIKKHSVQEPNFAVSFITLSEWGMVICERMKDTAQEQFE